MVKSPVISWIEGRYSVAFPVDDEMVKAPSMVSQDRLVKVASVVLGPAFALLLFVLSLANYGYGNVDKQESAATG